MVHAKPVRAFCQKGGLRNRIAFDDPGRVDRAWRQIHGGMSNFNNCA